MRDNRSDAETLAQRRKKCAQDVELDPTGFEETLAPQYFLSFAMLMIVTRSKSLAIDATAQTAAARTLSREFWQQKNFHAHRLRVSTPLAKDGFLLESNTADSGRHAPSNIAHRPSS
jgi:hypothetical protein